MRVRSDDHNQRFIEWVCSLTHDPAQTGPIIIPIGINSYRMTEPFYDHIYPPALLTRAHLDQYVFCDRAILTVRNDTVTEMNDKVLNGLIGIITDFFSVNEVRNDIVDADGLHETPPTELLQTSNPPSLPPSKLHLKIGAPVILLRNLYP